MFKTNILASLLFLMLIISSCEKLVVQPSIENTNTAIFDYVWKYTNDSYCCFDIKGVDWDLVYENYAPMINDEMPTDELMSILNDMLLELEDGTVSLHNATDTMSYKGYYLPYPRNLDVNTVQNFYKSADETYTMLGDVAYVNTFSYSACEGNFDEIRAMTSKLILDMRNVNKELRSRYESINETTETGGIRFFSNYVAVVNKFISQDSTVLGFARFNNELLESGGTTVKISQCPEPAIFDEIVVLCNRQTFQEGNKLAYAFTKIPNCTIIGDRTGGGSERLTTVLLPNEWLLSIPAGNLIDDNKYISEGFDPDIFINDDSTTTNTDEIIEKALELLN